MTRISPPLLALLKPQEDFEALREETLRRFGTRLCDLSYANAQEQAPSQVREALLSAVQSSRPSDFQYSPYGGATVARRLAARALSQSTGLAFGYRDLVLVPGAMAGLNLLLHALRTGTTDEALVVTPCWLDYPLYLESHGYQMRLAPVNAATLRLDLAAIEAALSPRTRVVMLSQPANPTGICYAESELVALARLLERAGRPLLISDECHRDFVYGARFVSPAVHYDHTCIVYSIGKKLRMQGQRIGYVAVSPRADGAATLREDLVRWTRISGICTPTALMQGSLGGLLAAPVPVADVARRAHHLVARLRECGYDVVEPDGTFFVYPRVPGDDWAFCQRLASLGVLALHGGVFHHHGHIRLSVTATDDVIERALPGLRDALLAEAA